MGETPLRVVARIKAKAENTDEVRRLLLALVEPTRREPGCLSYELLQNTKDPTNFTFVEEWASEAEFESHSTSDHIRAVGPNLQQIVKGSAGDRSLFNRTLRVSDRRCSSCSEGKFDSRLAEIESIAPTSNPLSSPGGHSNGSK